MTKQDFIIFVCLFIFFTVDATDQYKLTEQTRKLGLVVCRGTQIILICPIDGMEEIANPFEENDEDIVAATVGGDESGSS